MHARRRSRRLHWLIHARRLRDRSGCAVRRDYETRRQ